MACKKCRINISLKIMESLVDVSTDEFSTATFVLKINKYAPYNFAFTWYKNGNVLISHDRIHISHDGLRCILKIKSVTVEDEGVYSIVVSDGSSRVFSHAHLYVGTIMNAHSTNVDVLYLGPAQNRKMVEKGLRNVKVVVGDPINLTVKFSGKAIDKIIWYKGNQLLSLNREFSITCDSQSSTLLINHAEEKHTGIYHVVTRTVHGISSSFATVIVTHFGLITEKTVPSIIKGFPSDIENVIGQETRLTCKANCNPNSVILWIKDEEFLTDTENIIKTTDHFKDITLRLPNPRLSDTGKYTLLIKNLDTDELDKTSCDLSITCIPKILVDILTPLQNIASCFGSRLQLSCAFDLCDPNLYYVVWYIGEHRVVRTNEKFKVLNDGGEFYLLIDHIEPTMAGEIICELFIIGPKRRSNFIIKTTANLSIVPRRFILQVPRTRTDITKQLIFKYPIRQLTVNSFNKRHEIPVNTLKVCVCGANPAVDRVGDGLLVTYYRFDSNYFYLDIDDFKKDRSMNEVLVYQKDNHSHSLIIDWKYHDLARMGIKFFSIEFSQHGEDYIDAGVTSSPKFELIEPPAEDMFKFKITPTKCVTSACELSVTINPTTFEPDALPSKRLLPLQHFELIYESTDIIIGRGAFGTVELVKDEENKYFAAKKIITDTRHKVTFATREFELLNTLNHPKIIKLIDGFSCLGLSTFVLVTEFLWGRELYQRVVNEEHFCEADAINYLRQICNGLHYLHMNRVVHLDIKPENIVCVNPNSRLIKIIDFGLARVLHRNSVTAGAVYGTKEYVCPELITRGCITFSCDMWSLGVVTYVLLSGFQPFVGLKWPEMSHKITNCQYNYDDPVFKNISNQAKHFIDNLLQLLPEDRMDINAVIKHPWLNEGSSNEEKNKHLGETISNLKTYLTNYETLNKMKECPVAEDDQALAPTLAAKPRRHSLP